MANGKNGRCWVGFDLGGTKMLSAVYNSDYESLGRKRRRTRGHEGAEIGLERIRETIKKALADAERSVDQLKGIGIGCPGPLDLERGVICEAPNLGWRDVKIAKYLQDEFHCPVVLSNDVDAGVYGEYVRGAARGAHCAVGIFPGTGIGGGCVYEDRILQSNNGSCMEIGHIQVVPEGPLCGCGRVGCLEAVASRLAISSAAAQAAYRGHAPKLRELAGTDLSNIRSSALAEAIQQGDRVIEEIVRRAAEFIGVAASTLVNLLAPDVVVLGGGLVEAMPELYVKTVEKRARKQTLAPFADSFRVVAAELEDDAPVIGVAAWARKVIDSDG